MPQDHDESCIFWFALLQQDHDMTNHILTCCGSWTSKPQTLHLLLKLATKSIRNPAAIRDTRKWNPIVVEQEVVIWQPGLNFYLTEYVMSVDYSITIYTFIMSNHWMSYNVYYDLLSQTVFLPTSSLIHNYLLWLPHTIISSCLVVGMSPRLYWSHSFLF